MDFDKFKLHEIKFPRDFDFYEAKTGIDQLPDEIIDLDCNDEIVPHRKRMVKPVNEMTFIDSSYFLG